MSNSWYNTGYEGLKSEEERLSSMGGPQRFWVEVGSSKELVFVSDEPFMQSGFTA
jgi:hypothetical protein